MGRVGRFLCLALLRRETCTPQTVRSSLQDQLMLDYESILPAVIRQRPVKPLNQ